MPLESMTLPSVAARPSRALHLSVWLVQLLLAAAFLLVGHTHAIGPIDMAVARAPWVASLPVALVRFIGVAELAGALGLLLPAATRILPMLTPLAAAGLAMMMALAIPFHLVRGETSAILINVVLGSLAAFVAWTRTRRARIPARS
ncbi:MAG TPA: DoxX family protein [Gemmatimonadaceae bacterium]|nr:DoxX family protein [Gemmatimonadaceae bacterium]